MKTLYYASIDLGEKDIPKYEFEKFDNMVDYIIELLIDENCNPITDKVWLLTFCTDKYVNSHIIIDDCVGEIIDYLNAMKKFDLGDVSDGVLKYKYYNTYFLQEYESYEEAYNVALLMKEPNNLCYNKKVVTN